MLRIKKQALKSEVTFSGSHIEQARVISLLHSTYAFLLHGAYFLPFWAGPGKFMSKHFSEKNKNISIQKCTTASIECLEAYVQKYRITE